MTELEPRAGEELERQLDRYARVRLDPSPARAKRARSAVMEAAWRQRLGAPAAASSSTSTFVATASVIAMIPAVEPLPLTAPSSGGRAGSSWSGRGRLAASLAAAVIVGLTIGTSVFAASRAGGPLYEARLGLEELALPSDADARLEAELALAQGRLAEIVEAAARDDQRAVAASVNAYLTSLDDLDESTGGPADRALVAIQLHRAVLFDVLGEVPDQARSGIENALVESSRAIERLDAAASRPGEPGNGQGTGNGSGGGAGTTGSGPGTGSGNAGNQPGAGDRSDTGANGGRGDGQPPAEPTPRATPRPKATPARSIAPVASPAVRAPSAGDDQPDGGAGGGQP